MSTPSRDDFAALYLEQLPFSPYPLQEEALLAWFAGEGGVLVCAPTGTGKTLIAEAAMFEALHTGQTAYYTTPLIALSSQVTLASKGAMNSTCARSASAPWRATTSSGVTTVSGRDLDIRRPSLA